MQRGKPKTTSLLLSLTIMLAVLLPIGCAGSDEPSANQKTEAISKTHGVGETRKDTAGEPGGKNALSVRD
ncbi:MAG: hypothetical protein WA990_16460, partial [Rubrobacteraceae bacterium]